MEKAKDFKVLCLLSDIPLGNERNAEKRTFNVYEVLICCTDYILTVFEDQLIAVPLD